MSTPYLGQILLVGFNFAPVGYMQCNGQLLSISQYEALFALLGTTYGGNGQTTFALPDLRGRVPVHQGTGAGLSAYVTGQIGGVESVTLLAQQMAVHTHPPSCLDSSGSATVATANYFAAGPPEVYATPGATATMGSVVGATGGSQAHDNLQPYLTLTYVIAFEGIFPSRN